MKFFQITVLCFALTVFLISGCSQTFERRKNDAVFEAPGLADLVETDTLVFYTNTVYEALDRKRLAQFSALYDVDVEIVVTEYEDYTERVMNDLASGTGPDVLFLNYFESLDVVKAALNQSFLDLTDVLAEDATFSAEYYIDGIFEAGCLNGRQYMVPTMYEVPFMLSSADDLNALGFDWNEIDTTSDYMEELARLTPSAVQNSGYLQMLDSKNRFSVLFAASGISLIAYETEEVLPEETELRKFLEGYKAYFQYDYEESGTQWFSTSGHKKLLSKQCAFWYGLDIRESIVSISVLKENSHGYAAQAIPGQHGEIVSDISCGLAAINANSKNSLNAYRFVRFMLSDTIQNDHFGNLSGIPILKDAIQKAIYEAHAWSNARGDAMPDYENAALTAEEADQFFEMITDVDRYTIETPVVTDMLFDIMLPYFRDEMSYKSCLAELRSKLTFYLSE